MTSSSRPDPLLERHKPWQFTVRLFFGLAVLVSLFAAAASLLEGAPRWAVLAALAWCVLAWLYVRFRAVGPLFVLVAGTVLCGVPAWPVLLVAEMLGAWEIWQRWLYYAALWGITLSGSMAAVGAVGAWGARRRRAAFSPDVPIDVGRTAARRGFCLGVGMAAVHTLVLLGIALVAFRGADPQLCLDLAAALDGPLLFVVAVLRGNAFVRGFDYSEYAVALGVFGAILYFGAGWLAGYAAGVLRPPYVDR